jgi:hypothetical protein
MRKTTSSLKVVGTEAPLSLLARACSGLGLLTFVALGFLAGASCTSSSADDRNKTGGNGGGAGGADAGTPDAEPSGGNISVDPDSGADAAGGAAPLEPGWWISKDLPPPWPYFQEATERGYKDPSLDADVRDWFDGPVAAANKPSIVYPLDGAMHGVNQAHITFQFTRGNASNTVFRITGEGPSGIRYHFYVPCSSESCTYSLPESEWLWLGAGNLGEKVEFSVAGVSGKGAEVGTSEPVSAVFSPEPILGALYYWAARDETIKRGTFGAGLAVPLITNSTPGTTDSSTNPFACAGCHAVSRDGKVIAFAAGLSSSKPGVFPEHWWFDSSAAFRTAALGTDQGNASVMYGIVVAPTENPTEPLVRPTPVRYEEAGKSAYYPANQFGNNVALSPDGSIAIVTRSPAAENSSKDPSYSATSPYWPESIEFRSTSGNGAVLSQYYRGDSLFGAKRLPLHSEWSPDGESIVAALELDLEDHCNWTLGGINSARIAVLELTDGTSIDSVRIVSEPQGGAYHYYPTWSPDGRWILFMQDVGGCVHQDLKDPRVMMVESDCVNCACPGPHCVELTKATELLQPGDLLSWPKAAPFAQKPAGSDHASLIFLAVTSQRPYGFLASESSQTWLLGVDIDRASAGQDPSYPPVWMPEQLTTDGSLGTYWAKTLPCMQDPTGGCQGCTALEKCVMITAVDCECRSTVVPPR